MMRFACFLCVGVLVSLLAGCGASELGDITREGLRAAGVEDERADRIATGVAQTTASFAPMPFETERAVGGGIAVHSFQTQGRLYPDDELQRYVASVGMAIVRETPRNGFPFAFGVVENDDVNAWAAPGGYVFITTGALRAMEDEAQLAGVLAHEIAHVTEGHMVRMMRRSQGFQGIMTLSEAALENNMAQLSQSVNMGNKILFEQGIDQSMEYEGDQMGVVYAALTGYDPAGLLRFLEKLNAEQSARKGGWLTSTHPSLQTRIDRLRRQLAAEMDGVEGAVNAERFERMTRGISSN